MSAIKMEELEELEAKYGLEPDDLSYQHRCSRITAYENGEGESWEPPKKQRKKIPGEVVIGIVQEEPKKKVFDRTSSLWGKKILIAPMMKPDANRNIAFDEVLGPNIVVKDYNAGDHIYNEGEDVEKMVGDYDIIRVEKEHPVVAKTTFPKIGTEITYTIGDLAPVCTGNDGKRGYLWSCPPLEITLPEYDACFTVTGLKDWVRKNCLEIESKFSNKPVMDYVDGVSLVARIPETRSLINEYARQKRIDMQAGII